MNRESAMELAPVLRFDFCLHYVANVTLGDSTSIPVHFDA